AGVPCESEQAGRLRSGQATCNFVPPSVGAMPCIDRSRRDVGQVRIGYMQQDFKLPGGFTVLDYFLANLSQSADPNLRSASSARTFLHRFLFSGNQVFTQTNELSRGEQAKLLIASFAANELDFLILDEPTNNMDV